MTEHEQQQFEIEVERCDNACTEIVDGRKDAAQIMTTLEAVAAAMFVTATGGDARAAAQMMNDLFVPNVEKRLMEFAQQTAKTQS